MELRSLFLRPDATPFGFGGVYKLRPSFTTGFALHRTGSQLQCSVGDRLCSSFGSLIETFELLDVTRLRECFCAFPPWPGVWHLARRLTFLFRYGRTGIEPRPGKSVTLASVSSGAFALRLSEGLGTPVRPNLSSPDSRLELSQNTSKNL